VERGTNLHGQLPILELARARMFAQVGMVAAAADFESQADFGEIHGRGVLAKGVDELESGGILLGDDS
jgi:hypothetical protein